MKKIKSKKNKCLYPNNPSDCSGYEKRPTSLRCFYLDPSDFCNHNQQFIKSENKRKRINNFKNWFDSCQTLKEILLVIESIMQDYNQTKLTQFEVFKLIKYGVNDSKGVKF